MNMLNRLLASLSLPILSASMLLFSPLPIQATEFLTPSRFTFVDAHSRAMNIRGRGQDHLKFATDNKGTLHLTTFDELDDYLSFPNTINAKEGFSYAIREIHTQNPTMTFYEINATAGAHGMNCGYWIVGKHNGKWVTYVSLDSLETMGYTPGWHQIKPRINENNNGRFILIVDHEYMPPGAIYQYERRNAIDLELELYWDEEAQWFGMRSL